MSSLGREIAYCKLNACAIIHISTKDEIMEDIFAIDKIIAESLKCSNFQMVLQR